MAQLRLLPPLDIPHQTCDSEYMTIVIVKLVYSINFHDADDGDCYAGEGAKIVRGFQDEKKARSFIEEWNPILNAAENENTVFPVQRNNKLLKSDLGFTLHDINDGYGFKLVSEQLEIQD